MIVHTRTKSERLDVLNIMQHDAAQEPDPVCMACHGHIVYPNNGTRTEIYVPCFTAVDAVCNSERADHYAFCNLWMSSGAEPQSASMHHVIQMENFKLLACAWSEPYKHADSESEWTEPTSTHNAEEEEVEEDLDSSDSGDDDPPASLDEL